MGSTLMYKIRICQKAVQPLFHQRSLAFFMLKTEGSSLQPPLLARFLCTRDSDSHLGSRQTDRRSSGQTGVKNTTIRGREEESWYDAASGRGRSSPLRQHHSFPKSVFAAGTAKRTTELLRKKAALASRDEEEQLVKGTEGRTTRGAGKMQPPDRPLSAAEWRKLKESLGNRERFDLQMMCAMFALGSELDIAKSLLTFVAMERRTLSYELLLRYLTLCVKGGHDAEVFDIYDIMRGSFPSLDTGAYSLFIQSFSRTARWREALGILNEVKKVFSPSPRHYNDVISAAMSHGDATTAWALYDELIENGQSPLQETWDTLFKGVTGTEEEKEKAAEAMSQSEYQERLLGILLYMRNNQIYPQRSLASSIKTWSESLTGQKWTGSWTSASSNGVCRCCGSELESIQLTSEEYQLLRDGVMTDIIQGRDIFNKTTPEELERFKEFVKKKPDFDVVIDGLNVANINKDKRQQSATLLAVVSELQRQGRTILVLGRKHMLRPSRSWDRHDMQLIQQKAHCFFTENISKDDPFLLYAALHSGNHCQFVSRDLMRDHKACLPDGATRRLFFKWQRGHQLVLDGSVFTGRRVRFLSIPSYDTIVQTSEDSWHLPFDDTEDRSSCEVPLRWLCLNKKP